MAGLKPDVVISVQLTPDNSAGQLILSEPTAELKVVLTPVIIGPPGEAAPSNILATNDW